MPGFDDLPNEILDQILKDVKKIHDLNCLSQCSRGTYWAISGVLYTRAFEKRARSKGVDHAISCVFTHAVKHDSQNLIQWLIFRQYGSRLRGLFPLVEGFTFLHYALLQDAPKVAVQLVKHGSDVDEDNLLYPDLKSLYLAVARPHSNRLGALDGPLRIACSYALPRTAEFLLIRGADPNAYSDFGFAAIHIAVRRRLPWAQFKLFAWFDGEKDSESALWDAKVVRTVQVLLRFSADCNLPVQTFRHHTCDHTCWKSLACAPMEQRVLHIAAAGGYKSVISALIRWKANFFQADGDGNLPIVHAMAHNHEEIVVLLLRRMQRQRWGKTVNPIVCKSMKSTALHIACRFAYHNVASILLRDGADVNEVDAMGRTPLHEALRQCAPELETRLVDTLYLLSANDASPDAVDLNGKKARELGEKHIFSGVRSLFEYATMARYEWQRLTEGHQEKQKNEEDLEKYEAESESSDWGVTEPELPPPVNKDLVTMKAPIWVKNETFPEFKIPQPQRNDTKPASNKDCSAWGAGNVPKSAQVGVNPSEVKKGGRRKKWTPVSLK
ncbi:ankyrin repeat [Trichoderma arundinaceum]|uniref:Ankyrin repeat n=1 Tax=Trichoderma arundinaceum TaxID=490622 RepID=A0A395P125_TRIAR|nr:ankyrin repeat [Trichoderma arundinaceum]